MANLKVKDGDALDKFIQKTGAGTDLDPFVEPDLATIAGATRAVSTAHNTSATDSAATFTIAAPGAGDHIQLKTVYFGYDSAPSGATLTVSATGLTSIVVPVTSEGAGFLPMALRAPDNTAVTVTLSAGGSGVVGYCSAIYNTVTG